MLVSAIGQNKTAYNAGWYSIGVKRAEPLNQPNLDGTVANPTTPLNETKKTSELSKTSSTEETEETSEESQSPLAVLYGESELSDEELAQIAELRRIDSEVRQHEQAHMAAGGSLITGGANFELVRGPDGVLYAVGGDVSINVSAGNTPEETIQRAQQIRRAALAPANPSAADRSVAAAASRMEMEARMELQQQQTLKQAEPEQTSSQQNTIAIGSYNAISQPDTANLLNIFT